MSQIQQSVDVDVPVSVAYNQWTQFESFPQFMSGVESITQIDDTRNRWVTNIAGVKREFDTEITEQHPDERIAWRSIGGDAEHAGVVTFRRLGDTSTRVMIQSTGSLPVWPRRSALPSTWTSCRSSRTPSGSRSSLSPGVTRPAPGAATSRQGEGYEQLRQ